MIEPCPFCESSDENIGRTSESVIRFWVHCRTCCYDGPAKATVEQAIDAHNRLSRIVRAAERFIAARNAYIVNIGESPIHEIETIDGAKEVCLAESELAEAVEGGAE